MWHRWKSHYDILLVLLLIPWGAFHCYLVNLLNKYWSEDLPRYSIRKLTCHLFFIVNISFRSFFIIIAFCQCQWCYNNAYSDDSATQCSHTIVYCHWAAVSDVNVVANLATTSISCAEMPTDYCRSSVRSKQRTLTCGRSTSGIVILVQWENDRTNIPETVQCHSGISKKCHIQAYNSFNAFKYCVINLLS